MSTNSEAASAARRVEMKGSYVLRPVITAVTAHHLRYEYLPSKRFRYAGGEATARLTTLIEIATSDGFTGWGSVYTNPMLAEATIRHLRPHLIGRSWERPEDLAAELYSLTKWYGRKGAAVSVIGALDIACWDITAQRIGEPLYRCLGGTDPLVPAYASGLLWETEPSRLTEVAITYTNRGFTSVKMRLGVSLEYDREAIRAVRAAVGPDVSIRVDGSHQYDLATALTVCGWLEEAGVAWFEEPFDPDDLPALRDLASRTSVPLAAGENEFWTTGFHELIAANSLSYLQPDAARAGGISVVMAVGRATAEAGTRVAPHSWSDMIAVVANAHAVAALPNGETVEVDQTGNGFIDRFLVDAPLIQNGFLHLPEAAGLGVTPSPEALERYSYDVNDGVPDGNYSDMCFGAGQTSQRRYGDPVPPLEFDTMPVSHS